MVLQAASNNKLRNEQCRQAHFENTTQIYLCKKLFSSQLLLNCNEKETQNVINSHNVESHKFLHINRDFLNDSQSSFIAFLININFLSQIFTYKS